MKRYTIPMSYTPVDVTSIARKLQEYEHSHHEQIVLDFEAGLCKLTQSHHALALNTGTAALHLALKALQVQAGDYVICSSFTYVATINPVRYLDAIPILVDSEEDTWNISPVLLQQAIEECLREKKKPKAILIVHTYGMPAHMDKILEIARHYHIPVLEDAAEAIGSRWKEKALGTLGDIGVLSFNNNKTMTTYGGGALLMHDQLMQKKVYYWATQARTDLPHYEHEEIGYNYRMSPLNAAAGLAGLEALEVKVNNRRVLFDFYQSELKGIEATSQHEDAHSYSNRWLSCFVFKSEEQRKQISSLLFSKSIETRPLWKPMHLQPIFKEYPSYLNGVSERLFDKGICLPSGSIEAAEQVIETIASIV